MCGIIAVFGQYDKREIIKWTETIKHRGPDDTQYKFLNGFGCGFVRLSIIDLDGGKQPITNEDNSLILVCNGEIYNYKELRKQLSTNHVFKTNSDVEVILHLYEDEGIKCIDKLEGMYAFVIYDSVNDKIIAGRDHIGIKPLFYKMFSDKIVFFSELKIFDINELELNDEVIEYKKIFGFPIETDTTIYKGIYSLKPGNIALIDNTYQITFYPATYKAHYNSIEDALLHSVETHLVNSDVDVGIALSGGVDSSLIAILCKEIKNDIKTFVISDRQDSEDVYYANLLAKRYGFKHTEIIINNNIVSNLNYCLDGILNYDKSGVFENIGDKAVYLFYKEVSKYVKVIISGDGADELFGGYWMHKKPLGFKDKLKCRTNNVYIKKHLDCLFPEDNESIGKYNVLKLLFEIALPNYHLWTLDRCSMNFGVEARIPYLDIGVIKSVLQKDIIERTNKKLLYNLYIKYLPDEIINRNKKGFCDAFSSI